MTSFLFLALKHLWTKQKIKPETTRVPAAVAATAVPILLLDEEVFDAATGPGDGGDACGFGCDSGGWIGKGGFGVWIG